MAEYSRFVKSRFEDGAGGITLTFKEGEPLSKALSEKLILDALLKLNYGRFSATGRIARRILPMLRLAEKFDCKVDDIPSGNGLSSVARFVERKSGQEALSAQFHPSEENPDSSDRLELRAMNLSYSRELSRVYSGLFGRGN